MGELGRASGEDVPDQKLLFPDQGSAGTWTWGVQFFY